MKAGPKIQNFELRFNILNFSNDLGLHYAFYQAELNYKSGTSFAYQRI